jgi:hypothetical protein
MKKFATNDYCNEIWMKRLDELKEYIYENNKRPSPSDNKVLYGWFQNQLQIYKKKTQIMLNEEIYNEWAEFVEKYNQYLKI